MLLGPPSLARIDKLTTTVRDDHFRRGDGQLLAGGPTRDQIKEQIWGPYRFSPASVRMKPARTGSGGSWCTTTRCR